MERVNGVLNQYLKNYVNAKKIDLGKHLDMVEFYYIPQCTQWPKCHHWMNVGKKARKPIDLTIPMGQKDNSKKAMEMVKEREKLYTWVNKLLKKAQK